MKFDLPKPKSRHEKFLNAIAKREITDLPVPKSRNEIFLDFIAKNGGTGEGLTQDQKDKLNSIPTINTELNTIKTNNGNLENLQTINKDSLVQAINEVFTSASNGKKLIAQAITGKGVETNESDTFSTMAKNISDIPSTSGESITTDEINFLKAIKKKTKLSYLFYDYPDSEIEGMFDTSNVTNMGSMFSNCTNLINIPLLDTSNVTNMSYMFSYCTNLINIPLLDTSNVTNMSYMFSNCTNLTTIPLLDTSNVTNMSYMFNYCKNLTAIRFNPNANNIDNFNISYCTKMATEDLTGMIESLPTITKSIKITMGSTLISRVSEEAMEMLLTKGYTAV